MGGDICGAEEHRPLRPAPDPCGSCSHPRWSLPSRWTWASSLIGCRRYYRCNPLRVPEDLHLPCPHHLESGPMGPDSAQAGYSDQSVPDPELSLLPRQDRDAERRLPREPEPGGEYGWVHSICELSILPDSS